MKTKPLITMKFSVLHFFLCSFLMVIILGSSCKKEDPKPDPPSNDEEYITSCHLVLTDSARGISKTYTYTDPDGIGGKMPYYGGIQQSDSVLVLSEQSTYHLNLILLNQLQVPVDTISKEVTSEGDAHMVFFNPEASQWIATHPHVLSLQSIPLWIRYNDYDNSASKLPIGLRTTWYTKSKTSGTGAIKIVLKHQPGVKNGLYAPGETDLEVVFKCVIL